MRDQKSPFSTRKPLWAGAVTLLILVAGFGSWSIFATLSGAIIVPGMIQVDQNRQIVQHPDGGVVTDILVTEGQEVRRDQILLRLDPADLLTQKEITQNQLYEVMANLARFIAEQQNTNSPRFDPALRAAATKNAHVRALLDGQTRLLHARRDTLNRQIEQLGKRSLQTTDQILGLRAQRAALHRQMDLVTREGDDQQSLLAKGLAQSGRVMALRREGARLSGVIGELLSQEAQAKGRITEIELEVLRLQSARREEIETAIADLQNRETELSMRARAIERQSTQLDVRAPVGGIVFGLNVHTPRSVVRPAEPLLFLIPQGRPLIIVVNIESTHIDQVHIAQDAIVRFPALDQNRTPELNGRVTKISADTFVDERTGRRYYRAELTLLEGERDKLPGTIALLPGMPVEGFLRTADKRPISYLLKPFTDYFAKAFRE